MREGGREGGREGERRAFLHTTSSLPLNALSQRLLRTINCGRMPPRSVLLRPPALAVLVIAPVSVM